MRLLRYPGVLLLASSLFACPAPEDDSTTFEVPTTTIQPTTTGNTPSDESTTTGEPETTAPASTSTSGPATDTGSGTVGPATDTNQGQECGNGVIEGTEECDCGGDFCTPAGLGGEMCLGQSEILPNGEERFYTGGILNCSAASCQFDYLQCAFCGDENLNGMELCEQGDFGPSCQALGMGSATDDLPCAPNCLEWDTTCCAIPLPKECQ